MSASHVNGHFAKGTIPKNGKDRKKLGNKLPSHVN